MFRSLAPAKMPTPTNNRVRILNVAIMAIPEYLFIVEKAASEQE